MPLAIGQILHNRYRIAREIARGGFGAIYRAWDTSLDHTCAIKENLDTSVEAQHQFEREARLLAKLDHPNLARVTDYFFLPGQGQYLVMDFVEGQDLQEILDMVRGPLPVDRVARWMGEVCEAVAYLHSQTPPIIHRDIKPANIKVMPNGKVKLVDFGIAKVYDPNLRTTAGARCVTPGFSPPEQYGQGKTGPLTDVYALGATAYTLLAGQAPPDSVDILAHACPPPPPLARLNPAVPLAMSALIEQAMQLDPKNRVRSATELKARLSGPLGPPGLPGPPGLVVSDQTQLPGPLRQQAFIKPQGPAAQPSPHPYTPAAPAYRPAGGIPNAGITNAGMPNAGMPNAGMPNAPLPVSPQAVQRPGAQPPPYGLPVQKPASAGRSSATTNLVLAISSLALGLLSIPVTMFSFVGGIPLSLIGLVMGIICLAQKDKSHHRAATAGVVLGVLGLLAAIVYTVFIFVLVGMEMGY